MDQKNYDKALNYAMYLLGLRALTQKEVEEKLLSKAYEEKVIQQVLESLRSFGAIDDLQYAQNYIEARGVRYGRYRLKSGLLQKGISSETIESAFEALIEQTDEFARAKEILFKKTSGVHIETERLSEDYAYKMKIYGKYARFLVARGFSSDVVKTVISQWLSQEFIDEG